MAICKDPTGAVFSIWQPKAHKGASVDGRDRDAVLVRAPHEGRREGREVLQDVFGWSVKAGTDAGMVYREISADRRASRMGGMMELSPEQGPCRRTGSSTSPWTTATRARSAQDLGGKVIVPPMDIPRSAASRPGGLRRRAVRDHQAHVAAEHKAPLPSSAPAPSRRRRSDPDAPPERLRRCRHPSPGNPNETQTWSLFCS
jgi:predicted enzyme related to lactoylglutathione lyase